MAEQGNGAPLGPVIIGPRDTVDSKVPFKDLVDIEFTPTDPKESVAGSIPDLGKGTPSLFNPYALVVFPSAAGTAFNHGGGMANKIIDGGSATDESGNNGTPGYAGNLFSPSGNYLSGAKATPTISMLVSDEDLARKTPYYYSDFLYCKYIGEIPLNQLITLRRYPAPTFDNLAVPGSKDNPAPTPNATNTTSTAETPKPPGETEPGDFKPIAQAVTWYGEHTGNKLSDLLNFTVSMNWKSVEAEVNTASGNEQGSEDSPAPGIAKVLGILTGNVNTPFATANSQYDPYNNGPLAHRVYGPVNVISRTYKRERGLDFKNSITLNFEYSLKSIGNINPKAAMLDLMSNMLALTYNNAGFWGGANRYFPQAPTYPFLGGKDGMNAWYRGDPVGFAKAVGAQVTKAFDTISKTLASLAEDPIGTLKKIASGAAKLGMIEMGKGRAPSIVAMKSLLTGEPVGEWHMVLGNPYDPILAVGNLICTEAKFQFNDIIGADNFPTELKVTITVEHGRPRDAGDIQSMFNRGQGRIYYPPKDTKDYLNNSSATRNSTNDTSWGRSKKGGSAGNEGAGNDANRYSRSTKSVGLFTGSESEFDQIIGVFKSVGNAASATGKQAHITADKMFLRTGAYQKGK
jgi:hypothetical protein